MTSGLGPDRAVVVAFFSAPARVPRMACWVAPFPAPPVDPDMRFW